MPAFSRAMAWLQWLCFLVAGIGITVMVCNIGWGVVARYVFGKGSFWPEPVSIFIAIQMTFYGAAATYRSAMHMSLDIFVQAMPRLPRRVAHWFGHGVMTIIALAMIYYGTRLCLATMGQVFADFPYIYVGAIYTAIPISGVITLLFVIERAILDRRGDLTSGGIRAF